MKIYACFHKCSGFTEAVKNAASNKSISVTTLACDLTSKDDIKANLPETFRGDSRTTYRAS